MTELLYLPANDYETSFASDVTDTSTSEGGADGYVVLDKTLFYKEGGGQPADHGTLSWDDRSASVIDVQKTHGDIRHYIEGDLPSEGDHVTGEIDWGRRYQHMRMHTAQHVVSWVVLQEYGASTAGNQIHEEESRIDFAPVSFDDDDLQRIQTLANDMIRQEYSVEKTMMPRSRVEDEVAEGRTNLDLIPDSIDPLRVVIIGDEDICPCGGTHVENVDEIGGITIVEHENKGANTERLRFELTG